VLLRNLYAISTVAVAIFVPLVMYQRLFVIQTSDHHNLEKLSVESPTINLPTLPVELWEMILGCILDVPEYFGTSCAAADLPEFLAYHRARTLPSQSWDPYNQSWRSSSRLRLVSHTWARIVSNHAPPS
ncbi:hypothetical protein FRC17_005952, partial [Serendipita sp. 399]